MDRTGDPFDVQVEEWKHALEAMQLAARRRTDEPGSAFPDEVERIRREFLGLRIKLVAASHGPEDGREHALAVFDQVWADWAERARALQRALAE
ncbi:MAG TPA: hypothetical protein VIK83_02710 [Coriobacteriia bacterium]